MVMQADRDRVRELLRSGAVLVDVLPAQEYEAEHIPGAINIPLRTLGRATTRQLDAARPVIVYCHDYQ
jgi:rhodanese-related sulfurtransferase